MLKKIIPVVALTALIGATACERREETEIETPATETVTPAPTVEPAPPVTTDTMPLHDDTLMDTIPTDTL